MHSAVAPQVCGSCGSPALPDGGFCLFCGDVISVSGRLYARVCPSLQVASASSSKLVMPTETDWEYAGFWRRVWAGLIDLAVATVGAFLLMLLVDTVFKVAGRYMGMEHESLAYITGFSFIVFLTVGGWLYSASMESSRYRATIGKRLMRLQVVNASGGKLTFGQATARHLMKFFSLFSAGFGFAMAGWTKRRQALHDLPTDCLVIRVPEEKLSLFGSCR
jgi:uncharacterized RDD family membrane protein YckC